MQARTAVTSNLTLCCTYRCRIRTLSHHDILKMIWTSALFVETRKLRELAVVGQQPLVPSIHQRPFDDIGRFEAPSVRLIN